MNVIEQKKNYLHLMQERAREATQALTSIVLECERIEKEVKELEKKEKEKEHE